MASTSSPRKTPSARKRAAALPVAPDTADTPTEAATPPAADALPTPAPAPARKRAARKAPAKVATAVAEHEQAMSAGQEAAPVPIPEPEPPARKPRRRTTAAAKTQAVPTEVVAPEPAPAPMPEPAPAQNPAPQTAESITPSEPEPEPTPPPDLTPLHSTVTLLPGVRHQLHWTAGRHCPPDLATAAQALGTPTDAAPLVNDLALIELVGMARERRHPLQVEAAVWDWLAEARDMRARVEHLERQHPLGPHSPALAALVTAPLRPYQAEAALYAACAGRSVLADDAGLGKTVQAIAALRLIGQGFGAERVLILCPPERLDHWRTQWQQWTGTAAASLDAALEATPTVTAIVTDLASLATDLGRLQALAADAVVIDEGSHPATSPWAQPDTVAALHTLDSPWALALARTPLDNRPDAWQAMLDWVDPGHYGAVAALQGGHLDALAPWLLHRSRTLVLRQLPETVEQTTRVTLAPDARALHDTLLDQLHRGVQRWQRSQFLGSRTQRQLLHTLHALRQCGQDGKPAGALQAIDTALQATEAQVVVFSQWPAALDRLGAALQARGTAFRRLDPELAGDARRALVSEFQQTPALRVLLCGDDERGGQLGLRHAATAIVHLDRPWNPALLVQRLSRVHRTDRMRLVEVHHVVVDDSIESRLVDAQQADVGRDRFVGLVEGPHADAFLEGPRLTRFMAALAALTAQDTPHTPP